LCIQNHPFNCLALEAVSFEAKSTLWLLAGNSRFQARSLNITIKQNMRSPLEMLQNFTGEKLKKLGSC